jgi:hypothetical protein
MGTAYVKATEYPKITHEKHFAFPFLSSIDPGCVSAYSLSFTSQSR